MSGTTTLTLGGLLAALIVLAANLHPWWTGNREMKQLKAFGQGFVAAACAAACPGGILGWAHSHTGAAANKAGESTSSAAAGSSSTSNLTTGQLTGLSATGAVIVVVTVFLVSLSYKGAGKKDKKRLLGGAFVGSAFLLTAGVAGALNWVPAALNGIGDATVALVQGAGIL